MRSGEAADTRTGTVCLRDQRYVFAGVGGGGVGVASVRGPLVVGCEAVSPSPPAPRTSKRHTLVVTVCHATKYNCRVVIGIRNVPYAM